MDLTKLTEYFAKQNETARPATKETIDEMVARRKEQGVYTEEQLTELLSKVGQKQLFFIERIKGKVEIKKIWSDEMSMLSDHLSDFSFFKMSTTTSGMPEFIHNDLLLELKEKQCTL